MLPLFPDGRKIFNCFESEAALIKSELAVLSESVEANDKLLQFSKIFSLLDLWPLALFNDERLTVFLFLFSYSLCFLIPFLFLSILLLDCLLISLIVDNGLVQSLLCEA